MIATFRRLALLSSAILGISYSAIPVNVISAQETPSGGQITPMCVSGCIQALLVTATPSPVVAPPSQAGNVATYVIENQFAYDVELYNASCARTGSVQSCGSIVPRKDLAQRGRHDERESHLRNWHDRQWNGDAQCVP